MKHKTFLLISGAAVVAIGWALFRPELLFIDQRVSEVFPATKSVAKVDARPMVLASGMFHGVAHDTKGTATIYQLDGGKRVLRLTSFETSNGPDVRVLLTSAPDAADDATVKNAKRVELASLKGNIGDQNYDVPADVDVSQFKSVTIWCNRFNVNFGTAPLR